MIGDIAVDFSAKNQIGGDTSLYAYFGQVVLLNFSADWCSSCRQEAGHLEKLFQDYRDRGFQIIMVLGAGDPAAWASEYKLTFPIVEDWTGSVSTPYDTSWIPLNIILDRNMTIRASLGDYDEPTFIAVIKKYL